MRNFKSNFVKLIATIALVFTAVVAVQTINANNSTTVQVATKKKKMSKAEKATKHWIAMRESGGSYTARNGVCYGRYQLNIGYLHGDYSKKNQERTADNYVYGRYGSWVNAKRFWLSHHWY